MALHPDLEGMLAAARDEWNKAEGAIKLAEQVNGEIVNPAIYELRYAGRRLVEALSEPDLDKAKKLLGDAHFDCCRARHDAIDAATSKISADLDIAVQKLGANTVLTLFPEVSSLTFELGEVRDKIAISREDRENRDLIYGAIEGDNLKGIVTSYRKFKANEPLLREEAGRQRRASTRNNIFGWLGVVGLIVTVLSAVLTVYFYYNPLVQPTSNASASIEQGL